MLKSNIGKYCDLFCKWKSVPTTLICYDVTTPYGKDPQYI